MNEKERFFPLKGGEIVVGLAFAASFGLAAFALMYETVIAYGNDQHRAGWWIGQNDRCKEVMMLEQRLADEQDSNRFLRAAISRFVAIEYARKEEER